MVAVLQKPVAAPVAPVVYTRESPPPEPQPDALAGRRVLLLLASAGHAAQETLLPAEALRQLGADVRVATLDGEAIRFDPLCNALAAVEPGFRTLRLLARGRRHRTSSVALRRLLAAGTLPRFLDEIDAVVVPGGHGPVFAAFVRDPLVGQTIAHVHDRGGIVGLECHAVLAGALARRDDGRPLIDGHSVTCWPASVESRFAKIPGLGRYLAPFDTSVEEAVRAAAGETWCGNPLSLPLAVAHDRVVTTWGPWTAEPFARALAVAIASRPAPRLAAAPVAPAEVERGRTFTNWAGNFTCTPDVVAHPDSVAQVAEIVERAAAEGRTVRPVGSAYSYTQLAATDSVLVSLDRLTGVESYDPEGSVVRARAGTPLHALWPELVRLGVALPGAGDIDRQTVAGLLATATHGTGMSSGSFSSLVRGLTLVDGEGRVRHVTDPAMLRFAACSLGALGIVTHVDLAVVPAYHLRVTRWGARLDDLLQRLPELVAGHRNFEMFWFPGTDMVSCKAMDLCEPEGRGRGHGARRWFNEMLVENGLGWAASEAMRAVPSVRGALDRIAPYTVADETEVRPAHDAYATPRLVKHQEVEYALPIAAAVPALRALEAMIRESGTPTVWPIEVRFAPGEDVPLSPAYGRDTVWIAAHTYVKEDHRAYFGRCEHIFRAFGGRPHWGKMHTMTREELAALYPEMGAFRAARDQLDPRRRFGSPYLERVIG